MAQQVSCFFHTIALIWRGQPGGTGRPRAARTSGLASCVLMEGALRARAADLGSGQAS